jgi:predicted nucleic acid-binding protein
MNGEFVDTNIIVYAHDPTAGQKHAAALTLLQNLWESGAGRISIQVLQECYAALTRKAPKLLKPDAVIALIEDFATWEVYAPTATDVVAATRLATKHVVSIWDAMIVQAALASRCSILWSEDWQHGRRFGTLTVRNPFLQ